MITVWYNSIFFPVAEISSSITLGLLVWYGGLNVAVGGSVSLGMIFLFIQMSQMLFRPLRQIADKFNTLQMGMVSADRIFKILRTESQITDEGHWEPQNIEGKISIKNLGSVTYLMRRSFMELIWKSNLAKKLPL